MVGLTTHKLKLNTDYYDDSAIGVKNFEIRKNDRNFKVGDILELREWVWSAIDGKGAYTGNVHWKIITYILEDEAFLAKGYVCIAVAPFKATQDLKAEYEEKAEDWF